MDTHIKGLSPHLISVIDRFFQLLGDLITGGFFPSVFLILPSSHYPPYCTVLRILSFPCINTFVSSETFHPTNGE